MGIMENGKRRWNGLDGYGDCAPDFFLAGQRILPCAYRASAARGKAAEEMVQEAYEVMVFQSARFFGRTFPFRAACHERRRNGSGGVAGFHCVDDVHYFYRMTGCELKVSFSSGKGLFFYDPLVRGRNLWYDVFGGKGVYFSILSRRNAKWLSTM